LFLLQLEVGELLYQSYEHRISDAHDAWRDNQSALVARDEVLLQVLVVLRLEVEGVFLVLEPFEALQHEVPFGGEVHEAVIEAEVFHVILGAAKRVGDKPKLAVDEPDCVLRGLVLPVKPKFPVFIHQGVQVISLLLRHQAADGECHKGGFLLYRLH